MSASTSRAELARAVAWVEELRQRSAGCDLAETREIAAQLLLGRAGPVPPSERRSLGGVPVHELASTGERGVYLHFHGGGFVIGGAADDALFLSRLVDGVGVRALSVDYRLAPEAVFPAAVDDGVAAYNALLDGGVPASRIVFGGESAGGALAVLVVLAAVRAGLDHPAGMALQSPLTDFTLSGASMETHADTDRFTSRASIGSGVRAFLAGADPVGSSPLHQPDLELIPPLLVQVGDGEVLHDDGRRLVDAVSAAGGRATVSVWADVVHTWHGFAHMAQAERATEEVSAFINDVLPD